MAKGDIVIPISTETKAFRQGVQAGIIAPLDDAEKALDDLARSAGLDDVARDADKAGDKLDDLGRNRGPDRLEQAMKDAQTATDRLGDETKRTADAIEREFKDSYRDVKRAAEDAGDSGSKGFGKLHEAAGEVTQEVGQNLGEAVSSIRGDISDLGQVGQDTLGGLAATLAGTGPAGIAGAAALAAGAVGLGLVTAEIQKENERVQKLKQYFSDAWKAAVDGGKGYIDQATIVGEVNDIIFNPDRADEYKRIQDDAHTLGLNVNDLLRAAAGDQDKLNEVIGVSNQLYGEQQEKLDGIDHRTRGASPQYARLQSETHQLDEINKRWEQYGDINTENQRKAKRASEITSQTLLDQIAKTKDVGVEVDTLGNKIIHLPDGDVFIDANTGQASRNVDRFTEDVDGKIDRLNGREVVLNARIGHLDDSALRYYRPHTISVPASIRVMRPTID
ncbi:hypothetical protein [Microbacterium sp.]|uniref:hypothetical protein n=1 Tax=Microbacterium sp. TaxID=51671 RepID=UPI003A946A0D